MEALVGNLVDRYAPLVFVNGADSKSAQMFNLAHELAHLWFGSSAVFDLRELEPADDETEQACNRLAAEFLVPTSVMREFWPSAKQEPKPFQAIDLKLITRAEFIDFYQNYQEQERHSARDQEGGNFYATQNMRIGRRFAEAVICAAREGKLLYRDAYQLTGLYGNTFEKYAKSLIGVASRNS